jgi:hypothetical protein
MESHEVLKDAVKDTGVKAIASDMNLSSSLIYKWCEPSSTDVDAGANNPLDRIAQMLQITGDTRMVSWICQQAGGFFVKNPPSEKKTDKEAFNVTKQILKEFSEVLDVVTDSIEDDSYIDAKETKKIRTEWEDLKEIGESFVVACEKGSYAK